MDIKVNQIQLRKNLATKWDLNMGSGGQYPIADEDGKPIWEVMPDIISDKDTFVDSVHTTDDNSTVPYLFLMEKYSSVQQTLESFIHFPTSSISVGHNIKSATLWLYIYDTKSSADKNEIYTPIADWDESTLNWTNRPATDQFVGYLDVTQLGWTSVDITTLFINWHNGSINNYGLYIKPEYFDWGANYCAIHSRDNDENKPYIKVI